MRILAVDDDVVALELLSSTLTEAGHEVQTASNGVEALSALSRQACHVVITDWQMP